MGRFRRKSQLVVSLSYLVKHLVINFKPLSDSLEVAVVGAVQRNLHLQVGYFRFVVALEEDSKCLFTSPQEKTSSNVNTSL